MILKWRVVYGDGSHFDQYGLNGEVGWALAPRINMKLLELYTMEDKLIFRLHIPSKKHHLFFRRRNHKNMMTGHVKTIYCLGWVQRRYFFWQTWLIVYVYEDLHIERFTKWGNREPYRPFPLWDIEKKN